MAISLSIWSDIACPWCFVGKQRLEMALATLKAEGIDVDVRWRAFELDPRPKAKSSTPYVERLAKKYGRSVEQAQHMLDTMSDAIKASGGDCDFNRVQIANTFDAHRLVQWAGSTDAEGQTQGAQHQLTDRFMRAYLGEGLDLACNDDMLNVIESLGLDREGAAAVLAGQAFTEDVRQDEAFAQQHGISGVPFFVIGHYGISGAQEPSTLVEAIRKVHEEESDMAIQAQKSASDAPACDVDGCD